MCNRARNASQPEDETWFGDGFLTERSRDNRFDPVELRPKGRAYVVREENGRRGVDVMIWDVLGGQAAWPMTNVRNLGLKQWVSLAENPANRCLIPCTELCEWLVGQHLQHPARGRILQPSHQFWRRGPAGIDCEIMVVAAAGNNLRIAPIADTVLDEAPTREI